jgi:hypothetical protein
MPYRFDDPFPTLVGQSYALKSDHRDGSKKKSQWFITTQEEVNAFEGAYSMSWVSASGEPAWGLHLVDGKPTMLGTGYKDPSCPERLWLAKFIRNVLPVFWHGYPATYRRRNQDRPPVSVLRDWCNHGHIGKHEIAKIRGGKRCSLSD